MIVAALEQPAYLTIEETAALLRIGKTTCYQLARDGRLPGAFRIGAQFRVDRSALMASIREQAAGAAS